MGRRKQNSNTPKKYSVENKAVCGKDAYESSTLPAYSGNSSDVHLHSNDVQELCDQECYAERGKSVQTAISTEMWKDTKLRTATLMSGTFHVFQICGIVYLLLQSTVHHSVSCCQNDSATSNSGEPTSSVCHHKTIVLSEDYKGQKQQSTHGQKENQEVFLEELHIPRKSWEQVTTRINSMEKRIEKMFQSVGDLQRNWSNTEDMKEQFQEEDRNVNRSLVNLQSNIKKFQEEVMTNISGSLHESTWLEDKLQLFSKEFHNETIELMESKMKMSREKIYEQVMDGFGNTWTNDKDNLLTMYANLKDTVEDKMKEIDIKQQGITALINNKVRILKSDVDGKVKKVYKEVTYGISSLATLREQFGYFFKECEERDKRLEIKLSEINADFKEAAKKLIEVERKFKIVQQSIGTFTLDLKFTDEKVATIDESVKAISDLVREHSENLKKTDVKIDIQIGKVDRKLDNIKNEVDRKFHKADEKQNIVEKMVNERATEVKLKIDAEVKKVHEKVDEEKRRVESNLVGIRGQLDYFFREIKDINLYIVGFLLLVAVGAIFVTYKILLPRPQNQTAAQEPDHTSPPRSDHQQRIGGKSPSLIVDSISRRSLDPGITIINFNESTQQFHRDLIAKVPKSSSLYIQACNIKTTSEMVDTTPCRLVFIFVDFNERNIILEDPKTEIGDLRRLTTIGFQKMGCDVFVVYVKHRESEALQQGQMYSPRLYSVDKHPVLSQLKERNRVLSIYNNFHPHQVKYLEDCFKRL